MAQLQENIVRVLARIPVESIDEALPLYLRLAGTEDVHTFDFGSVRLAWVGPFLLLEGADASARSRVATIIVRDIQEVSLAVQALHGVLLDGPMPGPNGARLIARHPDGNVVEYIEQSTTDL